CGVGHDEHPRLARGPGRALAVAAQEPRPRAPRRDRLDALLEDRGHEGLQDAARAWNAQAGRAPVDVPQLRGRHEAGVVVALAEQVGQGVERLVGPGAPGVRDDVARPGLDEAARRGAARHARGAPQVAGGGAAERRVVGTAAEPVEREVQVERPRRPHAPRERSARRVAGGRGGARRVADRVLGGPGARARQDGHPSIVAPVAHAPGTPGSQSNRVSMSHAGSGAACLACAGCVPTAAVEAPAGQSGAASRASWSARSVNGSPTWPRTHRKRTGPARSVMTRSIAWTSSRFFTGCPPAVRHPLRFHATTHSDAHLIAYCESDSMRSGSAPGCARTAWSSAVSSATWLVPLAAPPESNVPSWLIHAHPMAPPGLLRHEPSVLTVITALLDHGRPRPPAAARGSGCVGAHCPPSAGVVVHA